MNCFRHPDETAIIFCHACRHALCRQCSQQRIRGVTHVCSDECARKVRRRPNPESLFNNVYAATFLILLLAVLGGGVCASLASSRRIGLEMQQNHRYYSRDRLGGIAEGGYKVFSAFLIAELRTQHCLCAT